MMKRVNFVGHSIATLLVAALFWYGFFPPPQPARAQLTPQGAYIVGTGGTANAQTATIPNISSLNDIKGVPITVVPSNTNTAPLTVNFNSFGAVNVVRMPSGAALGGGEVTSGTPVTLLYNGTSLFITSAQDTTPVGTAIDIRGSAAPTGYLIEDGSCVSQTTFAALFAVLSTNYNALTTGGSCSGGNFGVPDSRGTGFIARDNQGVNGAASRVTTAGSSCNAVSIVLCGAQSQTLTIPQLPVVTPAGSVVSINALQQNFVLSAGGTGIWAAQAGTGLNSTFTGTPFGSGNAHPILNPVLVGLRAIKY